MSLRTSAVRTLALAGAALAVTAAPVRAQALPTAQQVVARYVQAIGGLQALSSQQYRHMTAEMSMPAAGITINMDAYQARQGNKFVVKMEIPGMGNMGMGYDGQTAWSSNPMSGPKLLEGKELAEALRQYDFESNMNFARMYQAMETVGRDTLNGESCVQVRMTTQSGDQVMNCFADDDGMLIAASVNATTEAGTMQSDILFSDYRDFGGIKMPATTRMSAMGQQMEIHVKSISTEPIDASMFALPAEIAALKSN
ncbi:DUF4412 domain-containing protein [Longimicrobium terrae]|uniref:DUF4412 domain-containing protein n=1 Tax=Longimicrobium terrae TaxID=1639882 RepID=A0A841GXD1_9BACT|nr:DUF4412 domain-containing protein [Longimicrobium terrae]MBB4635602.1 hypothetical protein [Longimicrobium terrae]MBB6069996.1 hypothetical protein [Longimicrobium terrae]NNC32906.1 DUF4412 domain-containing protein [Longimicrobium terrae]